MQTAAISYRVADFLKQYPPFQSMEESDLLALAARGRVKFHETDEYVIWQGTSHTPFVYVIQQGTVSLWETSAGQERLRDIRGAGDMLGLDRFLGASTYLWSANTSSDTVVYAFPAADFEPLLSKYPQAARYVESHAFVSADYQPLGQRRGAHQVFLHDAVPHRDPLTCPAGASIREAARRMTEAGTAAIAVTEGDNRVAGIVTTGAILQWIAGPGNDPEARVEAIMSRTPCTIAPEVVVSQCVLAMAESESGVVVTTRDGTNEGQLHGIVTSSDVAPVFGGQPIEILREIAIAPDCNALRALLYGSRDFLLDQLTSPSSQDWLARFAHRADAGVVKRIVRIEPPPAGSYCLCFYGAAGRRESLTMSAPQAALIVEDAGALDGFLEWHGRLQTAIAASGYVAPEEDPGGWPPCATVEEWEERFRGWVDQPVLNDINSARPLFDLSPVHGNVDLWRRVHRGVKEAIVAEPSFVPILAHDALANLPPLTIFRDLVVEGTGEHTAVFNLERKALRPLVDVGRVFGIAAGCVLEGTSLERFSMARGLLPENESIFREAGETMRVVLYHQARAGIRSRSNGFELSPSILSGHDRQALKSGFRSILRLIEFTAERRWLGA